MAEGGAGMKITTNVYAVELWRWGRSWATHAVETLYFEYAFDAKRYFEKRSGNPGPTQIRRIRLRECVMEFEDGEYEYTPGKVIEEVRFDG